MNDEIDGRHLYHRYTQQYSLRLSSNTSLSLRMSHVHQLIIRRTNAYICYIKVKWTDTSSSNSAVLWQSMESLPCLSPLPPNRFVLEWRLWQWAETQALSSQRQWTLQQKHDGMTKHAGMTGMLGWQWMIVWQRLSKPFAMRAPNGNQSAATRCPWSGCTWSLLT